MKPTAPIRQTVDRHCRICQEKLGPSEHDICYGCWCYRQIPAIKSYQKRERYWECITNQDNPMRIATCCPKTGIPFLDVTKVTFWEIFFNPAEIASWRHLEEREGLE
tara:strand:+ start:839 stop:1159 length:321 start_codon:yes stop_codon:yes gene_type:complete